MEIEWRNEDGDGGWRWRMELSFACPRLFCLVVLRAGACFVFGFNVHLLAWVADAIVARCHGEPWASNRDAAPWWVAGRRMGSVRPAGAGT
jgi:hypothetical protein